MYFVVILDELFELLQSYLFNTLKISYERKENIFALLWLYRDNPNMSISKFQAKLSSGYKAIDKSYNKIVK